MKIDIHAKHIEVNATLRQFVQEKVGDLEHLIGQAGPVSARVEVGIPSSHHHKGAIFYAEVNLSIGGHLLRAQAEDFDLHTAIVEAKDDLKVQIKKFKEKAAGPKKGLRQ